MEAVSSRRLTYQNVPRGLKSRLDRGPIRYDVADRNLSLIKNNVYAYTHNKLTIQCANLFAHFRTSVGDHKSNMNGSNWLFTFSFMKPLHFGNLLKIGYKSKLQLIVLYTLHKFT